MRKKLFVIIMSIMLIMTMMPVTTLAAPSNPEVTSLDGVLFTVNADKDAGLGGDVKVTFTKSDSSYNGTLYLPGSADTSKLAFSWPAGMTVAGCTNGETPIPAKGESKTYSVTVGSSTASFTVKTMQGSEGVEGMFLEIDESKGTIDAMNGDKNHETVCFGSATFNDQTNYISMKGRGNATWTNPKKPYNITFYKSDDYEGKKQKVELIDGVESKKWSLLANYLDNSNLRNKIGYDVAKELGIGLDSRFVDVWINGEYLGNYLITPKSDYQVTDDGFILELDNYKEPADGDPQFTLNGLTETTASTSRYNRFTVKDTGDDLTLDTDGIHAWMQEAFDAIKDYSSDDYLNYIDLDSWAKMYLLNEFYKNYDIIAGSILMHRDGTEATDLLIAGPVWDLDNALGRINICPHNGVSTAIQQSADSWYIDSVGMNQFQGSKAYVCWFQELGKHPSFMKRVYELYNENQATINTAYDNIDKQSEIVRDSTIMNGNRWSICRTNANDYISSAVTYGSGTYAIRYEKTTTWDNAINNLKTYVSTRLKFLSDNLSVIMPDGGDVSGNTTLVKDEELTLTANTTADRYQWQLSTDGENWTDINGATDKTYSTTATMAMNGLMYRCIAQNTKSTINTSRVAKVAPAATMVMDSVTVTVLNDKVGFYVTANKEAKLDGRVDIIFTKSGSSYNGILYLPGGADASALKMSWGGDVSVTVNSAPCISGETAIPAKGKSITYAVNGTNYTVTTMQGSTGIKSLFFNIDENMGTIAAMNKDPDHETNCYGTAVFDGKTNYISMKGRGNHTWSSYDKKPYNITFYKSNDYEGKKQKVELIEGVEAKKWSILSNHTDGSLMRNKLGYDIANQMGVGIASDYIDVWMNGEYIGNYLITPKKDYQMPDEGYLMELDNFKDDAEPQFTLPGLTEVATNINRYNRITVTDIGDEYTGTIGDIEAWMNDVWTAIRDYDSDEYLDYIDLDSWAKEYILQELYKNYNVMCGSILMYREGTDPEDKLFFGPMWDLDDAMGAINTCQQSGIPADIQHSAHGWDIDSIATNKYNNKTPVAWLQELGKHESFMKRVYEIYNENKDSFEGEENGILHNLDVQKELLTDSAAMNFKRWKIDNSSCASHYSRDTSYGSGAYAVTYKKTTDFNSHVENLRTYLTKRILFLSDNLTVEAPSGGTITGAISLAVGDGLTLTADCTADSYQWQSSTDGENWTNIEGATGKTYSASALYTMNGLKIRCIAKNEGEVINTVRVAKAAPAMATVLAPVTLSVSLEGHEHNYSTVVTAPTCEAQGYTTYTCSCGNSYVDDYQLALGHNYVEGKCTRCEGKDPAYIPQCIVNKSVSLSEGTFTFTLGGQNLGEYTFTRSGNNWTIKDKNGKYLGFANNALSDNAFGWTYSNGRFQTSVTTTTSGGNQGFSGILGWLFGGIGGFGGNQTTTTTYYLVYTNGRISVSTGTNGSNTSFTQNVENMTHTYGGLITDENGQHSKTCTVCGNKVSEPCVYNQEGHKCICGRVDPDLSYVTATFVTGEGASLAPAAQTVISGEGKVTKPAKDPTRTGYIFDAWYESDKAFDFNSVITENLTITAKWIECNEHNYVNDICTKCGLKDPNAVTLCSGDISVSLAEGKLMFILGGQNLGEYTFARSGNNWTIKDKDGKYLGFANNTLSDNAFGWTYSNGHFQTSVTTTTSGGNQSFGGIFGWLFGGFGGGNRTTTTNYYLVYTNGHIAVSTSTNGANATFTKHVESDTHSFGAWTSRDGKHEHKCSVCGAVEEGNCIYGGDHKCTACGAYDPAAVSVNVSVALSQRTSGGNQSFGGIFGWLFGGFGGGNRTTTYTAAINVTVTGATASRVEYSTNGGSSWVNGNTVTSNSQIGDFLIRVTDSNGKVHNFKYENGSVEKAE